MWFAATIRPLSFLVSATLEATTRNLLEICLLLFPMEHMQLDTQVELKLSSESFMHLEAVRIQQTSRKWESGATEQLSGNGAA